MHSRATCANCVRSSALSPGASHGGAPANHRCCVSPSEPLSFCVCPSGGCIFFAPQVTGLDKGRLVEFDQGIYLEPGYTLETAAMYNTGFLYVPSQVHPAGP